MRVNYEDFTVKESHERSEDHPKVYTKIHLTYDFKGEGMDIEKVKKAVRLSLERYCPVHAMLKETVEMSHEIRINDKKIN
jgi:putative redox protein